MFDPNGIDVVIPLGKGSHFRNAELRYCLRSLERHAKGVRRVVLLGAKPNFISKHIRHHYTPINDFNKEARIMHKVLWGFENTDISDTVLFVNDDYVFVKDFDVREVKPYQRGTLLQSATPTEKVAATKYQLALLETHKALVKHKLPAFHYDLHVPILFKRDKFLSLRPWWELSRTSSTGLVGKSLYGNNVCRPVPGPRMNDCKVKEYTTHEKLLQRIEGRWMFSYGDTALYQGLETALFKLFPERSRFENN